MKRLNVLFLFIILFIPALVFSQNGQSWKRELTHLLGTKKISKLHIIGALASQKALKELSLKKYSNILCLTNAGHAAPHDISTAPAIDSITAITGCTVGSSSLGLINSSKNSSLWFAFYSRNSGECIYIEVKDGSVKYGPERIVKMGSTLFSRVVKRNVGLYEIKRDPTSFEKDVSARIFNGRIFAITGISNLWTHKNFTNELFNAVMLHNHFCPGVGSGIMILKYMEKYLPLKSNQSYKIVSCPNWCKEDAFQAIYDLTAGKKGIYTKFMTDEQKNMLPEYAKNIAGIYIRWDNKRNEGVGFVLGFSFDALLDSGQIDPKYKVASKIEKGINSLDYLSNPEKFISVIKNVNLNSSELVNLQKAGSDPIKVLGIY